MSRDYSVHATFYPPGAVQPLPAGSPPPQGARPVQIGGHQRDILLRCRRSPSRGTLIRRDTDLIRKAENQAAQALDRAGLVEFRTFGGSSMGWLWVVVMTARGRDAWLGVVRNPRIRIDTLQSSF